MKQFSKEWWENFAQTAAQDSEDLPLVGRPTGKLLRVFDLRAINVSQWQELEALSQVLLDQGKAIAPEELLPLLVDGVFQRVKKQGGVALLQELVREAEAAK